MVDPLAAEQYRRWSLFHYTANNPNRFIDPDGTRIDDYGLDQNGYISFLKKTDDKTDKLIARDDKGEKIDNTIEVAKGILNKKVTNKNLDSKEYSTLSLVDDFKAKELFEFVAENSNVEWSHIKYGKNKNVISTSNEETTERGGTHIMSKMIKDKETLRENNHSQP